MFKTFEDFNVDRSKNNIGWRHANEDAIRSFLGMPSRHSNGETNEIPWAERPLPMFGSSLTAAQAVMSKSREEYKAAEKKRRNAFVTFIEQRKRQIGRLKVKQRRHFMAHLNSIRQANEKQLKLSYTTYVQRLAKASRLLRHDNITFQQSPSPFGELPRNQHRVQLETIGNLQSSKVPSVPGLSCAQSRRLQASKDSWSRSPRAPRDWRKRPKTAPEHHHSPAADPLFPATALSLKAKNIRLATAAAWSPNVIKPQPDGKRLMLDVSHYGMPSEKVGPTIQLRIQHHKQTNASRVNKEALPSHPAIGISRLYLKDNRVGWEGALQVLRDMPKGVQHVDLSTNGIGTRVPAAPRLAQLLGEVYDRESGLPFKPGYKAWSNTDQLLSLNLAGNLIGVKGGVQILFAALKRCPRLTSLNLCKNQIDQSQIDTVARILSTATSLRDLDLSWNSITDASPLQLGNVPNLEELNLSSNALGKDAAKFAASLARNKHLVHVNLSDNAFGLEAVQVLAEQMKSNNTILGLHFDGANNRGYVDPNGFLMPLAGKDKRPKSIAPTCWICAGWREHKFYFRENGSLREMRRPEEEDAEIERKFQLDGKVDLKMSSKVANPVRTVFLRLEIDNWVPLKMVLREDSSGQPIHVLHRVLPPNVPIHYCFASSEKPHIVALDHRRTSITAIVPPFFDKSQPPVPKRRNKLRKRRSRSRTIRKFENKSSQSLLNQSSPQAAKSAKEASAPVCAAQAKAVRVNVLTLDKVVPFHKRTHIGRSRPRSQINAAELGSTSGIVFKDRRYVYWELEDFHLGFKQDWEKLRSKSSCATALERFHMTEQSLSALKKLLWQHYAELSTVHRYYSSLSANPNYFSLSQNEFHIFLQDAELPEDTNVSLLFLVTRSKSQYITSVPKPKESSGRMRRNSMAIASSVGRVSFFEIIMRLAMMLYCLGDDVGPDTLLKGLARLLEEIHAKMTYQVQHDVNKFRKQIVYLEATEESLHKYVPVLKWMFVIYCNHRVFAHILNEPAQPTSPVAGDRSPRGRKRKPKRIRKNLDIEELVKEVRLGFTGFRELLSDAGMISPYGKAVLPGFTEQQAVLAMMRSMPFTTPEPEGRAKARDIKFSMGIYDMLEVIVRLSTLLHFRICDRAMRTNADFEGRRTLHMGERVEALICAMLRMPRVSRKLWTCIPADVRAKGRFDSLFDLKAATATTPFPSPSMFSRNEPTIQKFLAFDDE